MRKEAGYEVDNRIKVVYNGMFRVFEQFGDIIKKETLANTLNKGKTGREHGFDERIQNR